MCFYDQFSFSCGGYKWGHFRHHCNREHRTGETCGIKLILHTLRVDSRCKRCEKLDTTFRRRQAEAMRISSWQRTISPWQQNERYEQAPLASFHVHSRSIPSQLVVSSMISVSGDTLRVGTSVGFPTYLDVQGISTPGCVNPHHGQWNRMMDGGVLYDVAGKDSARFVRNQQYDREELGAEPQCSRSNGVIAAYQSTKKWCECGYPPPHHPQECLSALLRAPSRTAGKTASAPEQNYVEPNPQKDRTIYGLYPRTVRSHMISILVNKTMVSPGSTSQTPSICKITAT